MNFDAARIAYLADGWDDMEITRDRAEMESDAKIVLAHKKIYIDIENVTGVPWWFLAVVDMREGGIGNLGTRHLHNGDRLTGYTVNVPFGRPKVGHGPPFTFFESAVDSVKYQGLDKIAKWTIERALHLLEAYNGFKYAMQKPPRPSPYVWSCCSVYDPPTGPGGKVCVDHGPIENVVNKQFGCAPFLQILADLDTTIKFARESETPSTVKPVAPATKTVAKAGTVAAAGAAAGKAAADAGAGPAGIAFAAIAGAIAVAIIWFLVSRRNAQ
jgi:lysozyme family protein